MSVHILEGYGHLDDELAPPRFNIILVMKICAARHLEERWSLKLYNDFNTFQLGERMDSVTNPD